MVAINFQSDLVDPDQAQEGLDQLCAYLVYKGLYKDTSTARQDARERAEFLDKADFFANDNDLAQATPARKEIAALIQGHSLEKLISDNDGYLPPMEEKTASASNKRPITEIFSSIELDLRTGLQRDQVIRKLVDSGLSEDNAVDAFDVVMRQRRQKQRTKLIGAVTIILLVAILFFFAR